VALAAIDPWLAEEAVKLIDVTHEVLPPVMDPLMAIEKTSPLLHEEPTIQSRGKDAGKGGNVANHIEHLKGDPEKGFAETDIIIEREFRVTTLHQGYSNRR
jgi:CO/xanthine dehydrogenase Mo-binding subunit